MLEKEACTLIPLRFCESPIEKILYLCLWEKIKDHCRRNPNITLFPQHEFTLGDNDFRADFFMYNDDRTVKVIIECDGHDFHEKTKEQAQNDKRRDRLFDRHGYNVLRFAGREIYSDPFRCAKEIWERVGLIYKEPRLASRG